MTDTPSPQQWEVITRGLQEVVCEDQTRTFEIIRARPYHIYWGTAPTGNIHIGYLLPLMKIRDFLSVGCTVTILIADLHAFLDSKKTPYDKIAERSDYYERTLRAALKYLGVADSPGLRFVRGSSFQLRPEYTLDTLRLLSTTRYTQAVHAGSETVKQSDDPLMTNLVYPVLQALDEEYLHVDAQFGGVDQRKILMFAREKLPELKYKKRDHLMNPMISGLRWGAAIPTPPCASATIEKMSSSAAVDSKIELLDTREAIEKKIKKVYCVVRNVEDNSLLDLLRDLLLKLNPEFKITRAPHHGGDTTFDTFESIRDAFANGDLHPSDLKRGVIDHLCNVIVPITENYNSP